MSLPLLLLLLLRAALATPSPYNPHDVSAISLYGPSAVYAPTMCPPSFTFRARARFLPELPRDRIGLLPSDVYVNDRRCTADAPALVFTPIGAAAHFPPQWHFEDPRYTARPVNFTCAEYRFAIRFGYFNDVSTDATGGVLDAQVVYFDFAVIPNSNPFAFCSYSARRIDHDRPLDHAPFPTKATWKQFKSRRPHLQRNDVKEVPLSDNPSTPEAGQPAQHGDTDQLGP